MVEVEGIFGGAVKCVEIEKNTNGENTLLGQHWHLGTKAKGAYGIKYPNIPSCKRWILNVMRIDPCNVVINALSIPLGEYVYKNETQKNWLGSHKQWSMWFNSMQREEPYQGLTCCESSWKKIVLSKTRTQVVHGYHQLAPKGVGVSLIMSTTLMFGAII